MAVRLPRIIVLEPPFIPVKQQLELLELLLEPLIRRMYVDGIDKQWQAWAIRNSL